ncbi:cupin domain-containing protein [Novosphingobium album (ex Hu et al. 2023)]|uniref:Cupin domain-containing protein n=1 Tax=Novosphingobium album (ex Hu et al. 2023) TaxID=2930093 RepID=A0ABT0B877_9SPHN|nr:cupin domain-containing protein [Novosphingobium album (ex Hu et al. 2023)]MCJ2181065.1 cupin domain-containing protein [Novosphingobium album (ex Hu et al. 2023)]
MTVQHIDGALDVVCDREAAEPPYVEMLVAAMRASACKAIWRSEEGDHREVFLPAGANGATLPMTCCYMDLERYAPALTDLLRPNDPAITTIGRVNAYVSPPGCGTPLHFDQRTVWIVQLFGEKTWHLADRPTVVDPHRNCVAPEGATSVDFDGQRLSVPKELAVHKLRPGDWLTVPRGTWHATRTESGSVSVSLAEPPLPREIRTTRHRGHPNGR